MANNMGNGQANQPSGSNLHDHGREETEQFNELSELSLEERMAVADRLGVPAENVREASAFGTASGTNEDEGINGATEAEDSDR